MNIRKNLLPSIMLAALFPQVVWAQGSMIWNHSFNYSFGDNVIITQANFWIDYGSNSSPSASSLFSGISFGTNDVGRTFTISSIADDPDFATVVNALTNGVDQRIEFFVGNSTLDRGALGSAAESQLFAGIGTGPDLIGYQIQSFGLHIDSLSFQSPGSNPNGDGNWTDWSEQVTWSIYGTQVPEPSSAAIILLGGGILLYLRHRRR